MAYRIVYGPKIPPKYRKKTDSSRLRIFPAICLLLFSLLVKQYYPAGAEKLQQFLLPGDPTHTQQALSSMMSQLQSGEAAAEAFTVFCREILANAAPIH
mgnify:CR=1 FL=1